jgi:hypothetical protein
VLSARYAHPSPQPFRCKEGLADLFHIVLHHNGVVDHTAQHLYSGFHGRSFWIGAEDR